MQVLVVDFEIQHGLHLELNYRFGLYGNTFGLVLCQHVWTFED